MLTDIKLDCLTSNRPPHHVAGAGELVHIQGFNGHPFDRQRTVLVILCVVVLVIYVTSKTKVGHLHHKLLVDPGG